MMTIGAIATARGCGKSRKAGGVYLETGMSPSGKPLEDFLIDPPMPVPDPESLGLSPQGVRLVERDGVWHVLDWVGAMHYTNPTDILEEVRRFGLSRRAEISAEDYAKLTFSSRILLVHPYGYLLNPAEYWKDRVGMKHEYFKGAYDWNHCPQHREDHEKPGALCIGLLWEDLTMIDLEASVSRTGRRQMPSFSYYGAARPPAIKKWRGHAGIVASFGITRVAIIEDPDNQTHLEKQKKLEGCKLPVEILEE